MLPPVQHISIHCEHGHIASQPSHCIMMVIPVSPIPPTFASGGYSMCNPRWPLPATATPHDQRQRMQHHWYDQNVYTVRSLTPMGSIYIFTYIYIYMYIAHAGVCNATCPARQCIGESECIISCSSYFYFRFIFKQIYDLRGNMNWTCMESIYMHRDNMNVKRGIEQNDDVLRCRS